MGAVDARAAAADTDHKNWYIKEPYNLESSGLRQGNATELLRLGSAPSRASNVDSPTAEDSLESRFRAPFAHPDRRGSA